MKINKKRLLTRKERAYILSKLMKEYSFEEDFKKLNKKQEEKLISSIIRKIQAPQDFKEKSKK
jgi:hypothetical protein